MCVCGGTLSSLTLMTVGPFPDPNYHGSKPIQTLIGKGFVACC